MQKKQLIIVFSNGVAQSGSGRSRACEVTVGDARRRPARSDNPQGYELRQKRKKRLNKSLYRGVEQLVARRAHNPEVVRFKSHPRNQKNSFERKFRADFYFLKVGGWGLKLKEGASRRKNSSVNCFKASGAEAGTESEAFGRRARKVCGAKFCPTPATIKKIGFKRNLSFLILFTFGDKHNKYSTSK